MFCYKIKLHSIIFSFWQSFGIERDRFVSDGIDLLRSNKHRGTNTSWEFEARTLVACCAFSLSSYVSFSLSLSPSFHHQCLSFSYHSTISLVHHAPSCIRSLRCLALGMRGPCFSLFLQYTCVLAHSFDFSLSFHLCFTRSCVLLTRTRFSSPLSLSICRVTSNSPASWLGVEWEERKPDVEILWYTFSFCLVHNFKKNWNSKSLRNLCCFLHVKNFSWNSFNNICCTICSHDLFSY